MNSQTGSGITAPLQRDHTSADPRSHRISESISHSPLHSLWDLEGLEPLELGKRTVTAFLADNLLGRAAELGYYFLFALFPTLVSASAILGLAARSASEIYLRLLHYFTLVIPPSALNLVLDTFNQTTQASSAGKITFGLATAIWSASVGFSAIMDAMNNVYKVRETRPYWKARLIAISATILLSIIVTLLLASMLMGDVLADAVKHNFTVHYISDATVMGTRIVGWLLAVALLAILFSVIYFLAPDLKTKKWRWFTPGGSIAIVCWLLASSGLRVYLHFFNTYSVTYGSLGAVIILLTWFYLTGVMLLLGAEINAVIEASVVARQLAVQGQLPETVH